MGVKGKVFLITGGTGFIGSALCKFLDKNGGQIFVLTRKSHNAANNINYINSISELQDVYVDTIINLGGESVVIIDENHNK